MVGLDSDMADTTVPTPPITPAPGNNSLGPPEQIGIVSIGRANKPDSPAIAKLGGETFAATFGHSVPSEDLDSFLATTYSADSVTAEFADPAKTYLVARTAAGRVVGIAQLVRGKTHSSLKEDPLEVAVIQRVYVDAAIHGQGIGTKLIVAVERMARDEGFKRLWLSVWDENPKAQKLYQRLGYERTGEIEFATGTCIQTDYVLAKQL